MFQCILLNPQAACRLCYRRYPACRHTPASPRTPRTRFRPPLYHQARPPHTRIPCHLARLRNFSRHLPRLTIPTATPSRRLTYLHLRPTYSLRTSCNHITAIHHHQHQSLHENNDSRWDLALIARNAGLVSRDTGCTLTDHRCLHLPLTLYTSSIVHHVLHTVPFYACSGDALVIDRYRMFGCITTHQRSIALYVCSYGSNEYNRAVLRLCNLVQFAVTSFVSVSRIWIRFRRQVARG